MSKKPVLIVIGGATASGKTNLAIQLAQYYDTDILSADSRQLYKLLNIGTAKPSAEELNSARHHFVDYIYPDQPYTVGDYEREAIALLEELFAEHNVVIMAGGSGLYIDAVLDGIDNTPDIPEAIREQVYADYEKLGLRVLLEELADVDETYYMQVDKKNPRRVIRAIEVFRASGIPFSSFRKKTSKIRPFHTIGLHTKWPRDVLYERINRRVDQMMADGLIKEIEYLQANSEVNARPLLKETLGYREMETYQLGLITLDEVTELIKRNTRRYAKRQLTWFRNKTDWTTVDMTTLSVPSLIDDINMQIEAL